MKRGRRTRKLFRDVCVLFSRCLESEGPAFRWIRSARKKRRAIKTGGGTFARTKGGGGGGGERGSGTGRRPNRNKGRRPGEDDDFSFGTSTILNNLFTLF